ncbi:MAG: hypothetical protein KC421_09635, partial [Anaerolineales bacterium]|nr:hypothetical protein [Anaerolineales bacterium]
LILVGGLAIKLLFPPNAKLTEVIGTAVYFPQSALVNPVNFNMRDGEWLQSPNLQPTNLQGKNGRWVVPLPHPSGASLWPNKPANKQLIAGAVQILRELRAAYDL